MPIIDGIGNFDKGHVIDGSFNEDEKGTQCKAAAAPATVSAEALDAGSYDPTTEAAALGRFVQFPMTHKPGDLPSRMVTDEAAGRGVSLVVQQLLCPSQ